MLRSTIVRMRLIPILIVLLAASGVACAGGDEPAAAPAKPRSTADVVKAVAVPPKLEAKAGATVTFDVKVTIAEHWHLYAHGYAEDPESYYIGIDLTPTEESPVKDVTVVYPDPVKGDFMGDAVMMHEGVQTLKVTAKIPANATGEVTLDLSLAAQACNNKVCLRPSDVPVPVVVKIS